MMTAAQVKRALRAHADPAKAKLLQGFFKTGPGEYGEGDVFIGVTVPQTRAVVRRFHDLPFPEIAFLLASKVHEERLAAVLLLVRRFERGDGTERKSIMDFYLAHSASVNNWDLVDLSAHRIVGAWLVDRPRGILKKLARSGLLWERRIAVISTFAFIARGELGDSFALADLLLRDEHDLMHKAVGWVLRECGKKDRAALERFLRPRYKTMPRTMLRYAIERFPEAERQRYLKGKV